jgi:AraC-like DNA-binding protein
MSDSVASYPLHIDIFALIIFLGTVQGFFLSVFFLSKPNRQVKSNIYLGLFLFSASFISLDILLSYTNYMFRVIYLVDVTEPINFLIGPCFYLFVVAKTTPDKLEKVYYHFLPFFIYLIYVILFTSQGYEFKYNSYLNQYHPALPKLIGGDVEFEDPIYLRSYINHLTILSIFIYVGLSYIQLLITLKAESATTIGKRDLRILWGDVVFMTGLLLVIIFVKLYFEYDLGDYLIIAVVTIFIYTTMIKVIKSSSFFEKPGSDKKYSKSGLTADAKKRIRGKITELMEKQKFYLNSASLPEMAKKVGSSANYVSQVINEELGLSFPEYIAQFRIEEAKRLIADPNSTESLENIGYSIGYNSKSTFFTTFKKLTGMTPAEYKKGLKK